MSHCHDECCRGEAPDSVKLSEEYATAHVEHRCDLCPDPIRPGDKYMRVVAVVDNEFIVSKSHYPDCPRDVREAIEHYERQAREDEAAYLADVQRGVAE